MLEEDSYDARNGEGPGTWNGGKVQVYGMGKKTLEGAVMHAHLEEDTKKKL